MSVSQAKTEVEKAKKKVVNTVKSRGKGAAQGPFSRLHDVKDEVMDYLKDGDDMLREAVHEYPISCVVAALCAGWVVGRALGAIRR